LWMYDMMGSEKGLGTSRADVKGDGA